MDPFTLRPGVLELDQGFGLASGPRAIDAAAGLVRYADPANDFPLGDVQAVAVLYVERQVARRVSGGDRLAPRLVHTVALVKKNAAPETAALLDAIARGALPRLFSIRGAA